MTEPEAFALELAAVAGAAALPFFRTACAEDDKGGDAFDPVTEADRAAERAMRRLIVQRHPHHGVIGEEYGEDRPEAETVWILDPIDGTRAFVAGLPLWTTLIAMRRRDGLTVGAIAQPYLGEVFLGGPSGATLLKAGVPPRSLSTRQGVTLSRAVAATTDPDLFTDAERPAWERLRATARLTRYGCDAYAYAMLAAGRIDLVAETGLKSWDWSALVPVIEAAGGRITDWRGMEPGDGRILAAGTAALADEARAILGPTESWDVS